MQWEDLVPFAFCFAAPVSVSDTSNVGCGLLLSKVSRLISVVPVEDVFEMIAARADLAEHH